MLCSSLVAGGVLSIEIILVEVVTVQISTRKLSFLEGHGLTH